MSYTYYRRAASDICKAFPGARIVCMFETGVDIVVPFVMRGNLCAVAIGSGCACAAPHMRYVLMSADNVAQLIANLIKDGHFCVPAGWIGYSGTLSIDTLESK